MRTRAERPPALEAAVAAIVARDPHQHEFLQAVKEVAYSLTPLFDRHPEYIAILPAMAEPERVIHFRVPWLDDQGNMQVNRGFRVQFSQMLGPYKGGLRFHPSVDASIIKFLGWEQIFKNALTGLPLGAGKGGSDFDPKGKSDVEVLRFCQSFMTELHRHIGPDTDVPAGDIGVGAREIGYMFGQWTRLTARVQGVLTGKGPTWGGSFIRPEATGYGAVYMTECALRDHGHGPLEGKAVAISGSGNAAGFAGDKAIELGAKVVSFSDSHGTVHEPHGFSKEQFDHLMAIKARRGRCKEYADISASCQYLEGQRPWRSIPCDVAIPCATENEVEWEDAQALGKHGALCVTEGSNMACTPDAINHLQNHALLFLPGKAANAGGVAVSGLEMAQNSARQQWTRDDVDGRLKAIIADIYEGSKAEAEQLGRPNDLQLGSNAKAFRRVADAMLAQGAFV